VTGAAIDVRALEQLRALARPHPAIHIVECKDDGLDFIGCDAYVALRQSENAETAILSAMAQGLAVVTTADDGQLSMLTSDNSWIVNLPSLQAPSAARPGHPELEDAARVMREIADNRGEAEARGARARAEVQAERGDQVIAALIAERLREIRAGRARWAALPSVIVPKEAPLSKHQPRPADTSAGTSIASLLPQLDSLAAPQVAEASASGGLRSAAQRLLFRILRPYWFQQYQLHKYMIEAFGRVASAATEEAQQREALDRRVRELSRQVAASAREIRRLEAGVRSPSSSTPPQPMSSPRGSSES